MNPPLGLAIDIIKRCLHIEELDRSELSDYLQGKKDAYEGLIEVLEGYKELVSQEYNLGARKIQ